MPAAAAYEAYGKVNLYLDVLDKRPDGYNNIETIFQSVGLCDELRFETTEDDAITVTCSHPDVPLDDSNLAVAAARLIRERAGAEGGVRIHIDKRLPIAGGMAGGSADCAATLVALNNLWGYGRSTGQLCDIALELGSDVPFCVRGGTAAATGRGEDFHPIQQLDEHWLVVVLPNIPIKAGELYGHEKLQRSMERAVEGKTPAFLHAMEMCDRPDLSRVVFNRMEVPAFFDHTELSVIKEVLIESGCVAAAMSGSGSAMFGVCASERDALRIASMDSDYPTHAVPTVPYGVRRIESAPE